MSHAPPTRAQELAFLRSVIYASLFDYPLTPAQLCESLIGEAADEPTLLRWYARSDLLNAAVEYCDGHFVPRGMRQLLQVRRQREATSRQLLAELAPPLAMIARLPFVRLVALSGSLAHLNADAGADLDLFVITRRRRVWTVTVVALVAARLRGWRKRLCLNYIVSERAMWVAPADLFSANQIVHLQPVAGEETYREFLAANRFVERFYPNFRPRALAEAGAVGAPALGTGAAHAVVERALDWTVAPWLEPLCRFLYRAHLRRRAHTWRSRDQVRLDRECLKLHTSSHRHEIMERFERAVEEALEHASMLAARKLG